jgi:hypothetical protein
MAVEQHDTPTAYTARHVNRNFLLTCVLLVTLMAGLTSFALGDREGRRQSIAPASSPALDCRAMWGQGFELEGVVGGRRTQAYFDMRSVAGGPEQVSGVARFPDEQAGQALADTLIGLTGSLSSDSCVVPSLTQHDGDADGSLWRLRIESTGRLAGARRMPDGRTEVVAFNIVPNVPCDAPSEWRTFRSPQWPITFDYPASWALTVDNDDITIECPSITALATTRPSLTFERGHFPPRNTDAAAEKDPSFTEPYWFLKLAGDDWRVGPHGCADADGGRERGEHCPPARRSARHGMTVLQGAAGEHRLYRPGVGYLGQGGGITRYLFIVGEQWISLDSAGEHSHYDDVGDAGGSVLLDGERIGDRVVRSLTAR